jgi:hypothetical protein
MNDFVVSKGKRKIRLKKSFIAWVEKNSNAM